MPQPTENTFLHFVIEPALLKRLDDFRFKNRFPSRSGAIKWLIAWALSQKPTPSDTEK
jgi:metal-responsive CopG/Arc/MetJ family transcriptional regulator